ncbi:MAG: hypothetical protein IKW10_03270 [Oscillospiraceae bacterium]|nr:hypothetical protein [Oscillospiraceae bacterium]
MQNTKNEQATAREVDVLRLLRMLWKKVWIIVGVMGIFGILAWGYSSFIIQPTYRTSFSAYINNRAITEETTNNSTTTSDLNASRGLMYVYEDIVSSRTVLQKAAAQCGFKVNAGMVSVVTAETAPILTVYVTTYNPVNSQQLAEAIADVAPVQVAEVVKGSTMTLIDPPFTPSSPYSPNIMRNVAYSLILGLLASVIGLVIVDVVYDNVLEGDDLENRYHIPVVGRIPDYQLAQRNDSRYGQTKERGVRR